MMDAQRVVVFRPGALGDCLLAADALAGLRDVFPEAPVELVGHQGAGQVLRESGVIDVVTPFDAPEVTSLFLDQPLVPPRWHGARVVVLWMRGADSLRAAFRREGAQLVVAAPGEPDDSAVHVADYLVATLAPAGVAPQGRPVVLAGRAPGSNHSSRTAILHPGSGSPRKNWPAAHFAEIARRLQQRGWSVRLLQGPADAEAVDAVQDRGRGMLVIEPRDTFELAAVLGSAGLYIGNDSGVSHLAARLGVATVAAFGSTDPRRWAPRGPEVRVVGDLGRWPSVEEVLSAAVQHESSG